MIASNSLGVCAFIAASLTVLTGAKPLIRRTPKSTHDALQNMTVPSTGPKVLMRGKRKFTRDTSQNMAVDSVGRMAKESVGGGLMRSARKSAHNSQQRIAVDSSGVADVDLDLNINPSSTTDADCCLMRTKITIGKDGQKFTTQFGEKSWPQWLSKEQCESGNYVVKSTNGDRLFLTWLKGSRASPYTGASGKCVLDWKGPRCAEADYDRANCEAPLAQAVLAAADNQVIEKAPRVGGWGGSCTCPDGQVYQVGDNFDACGSLACVGGTSGTCNKRVGDWANRKVVCAQGTGNPPSTGGSCWKSLNGIAAEEGGKIAGMSAIPFNVEACQKACDGNSKCKSFTACQTYNRCWFKAKEVSAGESLGPAHGSCKTYYKGSGGCGTGPVTRRRRNPTPVTRRRRNPTPAPTLAPTPPPPTPCWKSLDGIAADEGDDPGMSEAAFNVDACQKACDANSKCNSFSGCPDYNKCWFKTKEVSDGESLGKAHGGCKTYYKGLCGGFGTGPVTRRRRNPAPRRRSSTPRRRQGKPVAGCSGPAADACNVPAGSCARLSGHKNCGGQTVVRGTLQLQSNAKLHTKKIHVHKGGRLIVGTPSSPVSNVEINLGHFGEIFSEGNTYIYGQPKTSWSKLSQPCDRCKTIKVHECKGWEVNDELVLVAIDRQYGTEKRKIASIGGGCRITLNQNAGRKYKSEMYKGRVPIMCEVLNMRRSVWIHGHHIVTRQHHAGIMQVHHARIHNCGKKELGAYCLHFHHVRACPECSFVGNAVGGPSENKGITIHGTSQALVENNVIYDHRGAFLYVEDGNEIKNVIKGNALVCPTLTTRADNGCSYNGIRQHVGSDKGARGNTGLYAVSVNNDFIGNHIAGMGEAFFQDFQSFSKVWGGDKESKSKACPQALPYRTVSDNYFHNNAHFGFYSPHSTYPTRVQTDDNGLVTNWNSCLGFDPVSGDDNSAAYTVDNHHELYQNFGAGGYDGGETSFRNAKFAFNNAGNYYKTFRRGIRSGPFCENCFYTDNLGPMTSGGSCMWEYKNTVFEATLHGLQVNHHCGNNGEWTGGLCASHVWFTGNSEWKGTFKIGNDCFDGCKQYTDVLVHLKGNTYFNTRAAHPAFKENGCQRGQAGGQWTRCQASNIRIVRIYSANRGQLRVTNTNERYSRTVPYTPWKKHPWGRPNAYDKATKYQNGGMGYTFLVKAGQSYILDVGGGPEQDFFTLEYSDVQMPNDFIHIEVRGAPVISGGRCTIRSNHKRNWITPYGPYVPQSGAWWDCKKWPVSYSIAKYGQEERQHLRSHGVRL